MRFVGALALNDLRNIPREPLVLFMLLAPWVYVLALRLVLPMLTVWLMATYGVSVADYYPLILTVYTLPIPMFVGIVYGLLFMDERDDHVFPALQVTRVSLESYLLYRVFVAIAISIPYSIVYSMATGLISGEALSQTLPAFVVSSVIAPITMMFMVAFSTNKVEALAVLKALGPVLMLAAIVPFFWRSDWQLLLGFVPSYWPARAYWLMYTGKSALVYLAAGSLYGLAVCAWLLSVIKRKIADMS